MTSTCSGPVGFRNEHTDQWTTYVREQAGAERRPLRPFGPKAGNHPSIGTPCPACRVPFAEGDYTTLVALGPGDDPESQKRAREGRFYNAVALEVHLACGAGAAQEAAE